MTNSIDDNDIYISRLLGNEEPVTIRPKELVLTKDLFNNLGSCGNHKVQIYYHLEESKTAASPKVLYDCGIVSEFEESKDILFEYFGNAPRSKISFTVPPSSGKISWLRSFISLYADDDTALDFFPQVEIMNETKGTKWSHAKHFDRIPESKNTVINWWSSWKFGEELEAGDRVNLHVLSDLSLIKSDIDLVYDYELADQDNLVDRYLGDMTKFSGQLFVIYIYCLFTSHRTLYRMSLVKE